jgi:hypothetical protein
MRRPRGRDGVLVDEVDGCEGRKHLRQACAVPGGQQPAYGVEIELVLAPPCVPAQKQRLRRAEALDVETPRRRPEGPMLRDGGRVGTERGQHRTKVWTGCAAGAGHGDEALRGSRGRGHALAVGS